MEFLDGNRWRTAEAGGLPVSDERETLFSVRTRSPSGPLLPNPDRAVDETLGWWTLGTGHWAGLKNRGGFQWHWPKYV